MPGQPFVIVAGTPHFRKNRQLRTLSSNPVESSLNFYQVPVYITKRDIKLNSCYLQFFFHNLPIIKQCFSISQNLIQDLLLH